MFIESFKVESPNVHYAENEIHSVYNYETTELVHENRKGTYQWIVKPKTVKYEFKTDTHVPKLGFAPPFSLFLSFSSFPFSSFFLFYFLSESKYHFDQFLADFANCSQGSV